MDNSWVEVEFPLGTPVVLYNVPNGMGSAFTEARDLGGAVDATITLYLRDANNDPVVDFPAEDLVLEPSADFDSPCPGGTIADGNTDVNGMTQWVNPLFAGGWSEGSTVVMIGGIPLHPFPGFLPISHNSPDINGDLIVNLIDVSLFAQGYFGDYSFRIDLRYDGVINLADLSLFAQGMGAACP